MNVKYVEDKELITNMKHLLCIIGTHKYGSYRYIHCGADKIKYCVRCYKAKIY